MSALPLADFSHAFGQSFRVLPSNEQAAQASASLDRRQLGAAASSFFARSGAFHRAFQPSFREENPSFIDAEQAGIALSRAPNAHSKTRQVTMTNL